MLKSTFLSIFSIGILGLYLPVYAPLIGGDPIPLSFFLDFDSKQNIIIGRCLEKIGYKLVTTTIKKYLDEKDSENNPDISATVMWTHNSASRQKQKAIARPLIIKKLKREVIKFKSLIKKKKEANRNLKSFSYSFLVD